MYFLQETIRHSNSTYRSCFFGGTFLIVKWSLGRSVSCKPHNVWCICICRAQWHFSISSQGEAIISWKPRRGSRARVWANWSSTLVRAPGTQEYVSWGKRESLRPRTAGRSQAEHNGDVEISGPAGIYIPSKVHTLPVVTLWNGNTVSWERGQIPPKTRWLRASSAAKSFCVCREQLVWKVWVWFQSRTVEKKGGSAHMQHKLTRNYLETPFLTGSSERNWKGAVQGATRSYQLFWCVLHRREHVPSLKYP